MRSGADKGSEVEGRGGSDNGSEAMVHRTIMGGGGGGGE